MKHANRNIETIVIAAILMALHEPGLLLFTPLHNYLLLNPG